MEYNLKKKYFNALIGFEYSYYNPVIYDRYSSSRPAFVYYNILLACMPSVKGKYSWEYFYDSLLDFMDKSNQYCKTLQTIYLGNSDLLKKVSHTHSETPIEDFKKMINGCNQTSKNILIPVILIENDQTHRNTLIVTPRKEIYRIEPNHKDIDEHNDTFIKYFENSGYTFKGHYKKNEPLKFCIHGSFCNALAVLHYFIDITKPSDVHNILVDYFKWEYKKLFNSEFEYKLNKVYIIDLYLNNTDIKPEFILINGKKFNSFDKNAKNEICSNESISITFQLPEDPYSHDLNTLVIPNSKTNFGINSRLKTIERDIKFLKSI